MAKKHKKTITKKKEVTQSFITPVIGKGIADFQSHLLLLGVSEDVITFVDTHDNAEYMQTFRFGLFKVVHASYEVEVKKQRMGF